MSGFSAARRSPASRREIALTSGMLVIEIIATMFLASDLLPALFHSGDGGFQVARTGLFATVVFILIYSNVVYLVTRLGYFVRRLRHRPPAFEALVGSH